MSELLRVWWATFDASNSFERHSMVSALYERINGTDLLAERQAFLKAHSQYRNMVMRERKASEINVEMRRENNRLRRLVGERSDKMPRGRR